MARQSDTPNTPGHAPEPGSGSSLLSLVAVAGMVLIGVVVGDHSVKGAGAVASPAFAETTAGFADAKAAIEAGHVERARKIFRYLAKKGDARAAYQLGLLDEVGSGRRGVDMAKAATWYKQAEAAGIVDAKARLGHLYLEGIGVLQDFVKARGLLADAADDGDAQAQFDLARMWETGWGGEKDRAMAYVYYEFAARQDFKPAITARDKLLAQFSAAEVTESQALLKKLEGEVLNGAAPAHGGTGGSKKVEVDK